MLVFVAILFVVSPVFGDALETNQEARSDIQSTSAGDLQPVLQPQKVDIDDVIKAATDLGIGEPGIIDRRAEADSRFDGLEQFLNGYVAAHLADGFPPAAMVAVASRQGAWVKAWGVSNVDIGEPATPDSIFRIASISKTFTWIAVMMLVDAGEISLDADVNDYLETIKIPATFDEPVTLNDLMAHRAGFEDTVGDFFESRSGRNLEEMLINQMPARVAPPGERVAYSNWGTSLAAQLVSDVSGLPFDSFVRTKILTPLRMHSTTMRDPVSVARTALNPAALDERIVSPHRQKLGAAQAMDFTAVEPGFPAGAFGISARDAIVWMQLLLNEGRYDGGRLLSQSAFDLMRTRQFEGEATGPGFAHGFMEDEVAGFSAYGHGGTLAGFISNMTIIPELDVGVFVVVNGVEGPRLPDLIARAVAEQLAGRNSFNFGPQSALSDTALEATKDAAQELAGVYLGNRRLFSKFEKINALGSEMTIVAQEDGSIAVTSDGNVNRYYGLRGDLWTDHGRGRIFVHRDATGKISRLTSGMGTNSYEPVGFFTSSQGFNVALGLAALFSVSTFLGAWRRQGRFMEALTTSKSLSAVTMLSAISWVIFFIILGVGMASISAMDLSKLIENGWPPLSLVAIRFAAHGGAFFALLNAVAIVPVWMISRWSIWRKMHHLAFALAGLFAIYALWEWRLILSPMTTV